MAWDRDAGAIVRWARFSTDSLARVDDIELAALKVHIVLEDALKFLLAQRLGVPEDAFFDTSVDFGALIEVSLAGIDTPHLKGALRALNAARNHVSHRVDSPEFDDKLETFVREIAYMSKRRHVWGLKSPLS
jgi:hypothetical protein